MARYLSARQMAEIAKRRKPGYVDALRMIGRADGDGLWVDADCPAVIELRERYLLSPTPPAAAATSSHAVNVRESIDRQIGQNARELAEAIDKARAGLAEADAVGDQLAALLDRLGAERFKRALTAVAGSNCGCNGRRKWINDHVKGTWTGRLAAGFLASLNEILA